VVTSVSRRTPRLGQAIRPSVGDVNERDDVGRARRPRRAALRRLLDDHARRLARAGGATTGGWVDLQRHAPGVTSRTFSRSVAPFSTRAAPRGQRGPASTSTACCSCVTRRAPSRSIRPQRDVRKLLAQQRAAATAIGSMGFRMPLPRR
jgi:hypothetical protein